MAIKTFTAGSVLTASDTNTYLTNAGLVYVTSATIGSAVASVPVANCFTSTYDNYRVVIHGGTGTTGVFCMTFDASGTASVTGYYVGFSGYYYAGGASNYNGNNAANIFVAGGGITSQFMVVNMDIFGVKKAAYTNFAGDYIGSDNAGRFGGYHGVATAYDGFTVTSNSGTMTGGTITVYGYRKA